MPLSRSWSWRTRWGSTCVKLPPRRTCSTAGWRPWQLLRRPTRSLTLRDPETGTGRWQRRVKRKLGRFLRGWERHLLWNSPFNNYIMRCWDYRKLNTSGVSIFTTLLQGDRGSQSGDWASEGEEGGGISEASHFGRNPKLCIKLHINCSICRLEGKIVFIHQIANCRQLQQLAELEIKHARYVGHGKYGLNSVV